MDFNALVDEIVARAAAKMEAAGDEACPCGEAGDGKPGLLILTQEHGSVCHSMLESPRLLEYYRTDCALMKEYDCEMADYEAVILFDLTVDALTRLAGGACATPVTALAQKAHLLGQKIYVPQEAVELFQYAETVPSAYYQMLLDKLTLLKQSGVVVCPAAGLEDAILSGEGMAVCMPAAPAAAPEPTEAEASVAGGREETLTKRIITERDIAAVYDRDLAVVHVGPKSILTDLAREYAANRGVKVVKD